MNTIVGLLQGFHLISSGIFHAASTEVTRDQKIKNT